jgi:integrase
MAKRLTQISVENAKPDRTKRVEIPDAGKPGLYLVIQPSGKKSWAVRYRIDGKPRKLTLKGLPSLAVAHTLAQQALDKVAQGSDPASERPVPVRKPDLFRTVAAEFIKRHVNENTRASYANDVRRRFTKDILPQLGDMDIRQVTRLDVNRVLDAVADRGGGLSGNVIHSMLRSLFAYAVDRGNIDVSPMAAMKKPLKEGSRDRVLSDSEISRLWIACEGLGYPGGPFVQVLLLTGQRRTEVGGMRWDELNLEERVWHLPGERAKNGKPHSIPLSDAVIEIINSVPKIGSYVFSSGGGYPFIGYHRAKVAIDVIDPLDGNWVLHDLRRTVATNMAKLHVPLQVAEAVLNHTGTLGGIAGVYNKHTYADEKRKALETWANYVVGLHRPSDNVVRFLAGKA